MRKVRKQAAEKERAIDARQDAISGWPNLWCAVDYRVGFP